MEYWLRMAKKNKSWLIVVVLLAIIFIFFNSSSQSITGNERVTVTAPNQVGPNQNFDLTYSASGVSGLWGIPVEQSVNGACTLPNDGLAEEGKVYLNNGAGTVLTQQVRSNGVGTCSYSGIYFVDGQQHTLNNINVNVVACTPQCNYANACAASVNDGCGSVCTRQVIRKTSIDTNCDNMVTGQELSVGVTKWSINQLGSQELSLAITDWASR